VPDGENLLRAGRRVFREEVKEYLIHAILDGRLKAGDRVIEMHVAQELGVSQGPVREALRDLELLGFVTSTPFRGTQVRAVSAAELVEIYPIRAALEGVAAHAAAARMDAPTLATLEELYARMATAAAAGDGPAHAEADIAFHRAIIEASGNRLLMQFWDTMRLATTTSMSALLTHRPLADLSARHAPILAALRARDGAAAEAAMRWHIEELREWILAAHQEGNADDLRAGEDNSDAKVDRPQYARA